MTIEPWRPWENVKCYFVNRPPVVLFGIGLLACSLTLIFLAVYVKDIGQLQNPNVLSWNTFLGNVASLEFCVEESKSNVTSLPSGLTVFINAPLSFSDGVDDLMKGSVLVGVIPPHVYSIGATYEPDGNVTMWTAVSRNASAPVCLFFEHADFIQRFDTTSEGYSDCSKDILLGKSVKRFSVKTLNMEKKPHSTDISEACLTGKAYRLFKKYIPVPGLDEFFSEGDRLVIEMHLWHTSYFVIVMVVSLIIYSSLRGTHFTNGRSGSGRNSKRNSAVAVDSTGHVELLKDVKDSPDA